MIYEALFNNSALIIIAFVLVHLFVFYAIGAIIQEYFSFKKSNRLLSIPVGYVSWALVTSFTYVLPILLGLDKIWFNLMGSIKDISLMFVIILYYRSWAPNYKEINTRALLRAPIGYVIAAISVTMLLLLIRKAGWGEYDYQFTGALWIMKYQILGEIPENLPAEDLINWNEIFSHPPLFNTGIGFADIENIDGTITVSSPKPVLETLEKFESIYYWIMLSEAQLTSVSTQDFVEIVMPTLIIITIATSILGTMIDSEKSLISYVYSSVIILLITLLAAYIGPWKQEFYVIPLLTIPVALLFNYSNQFNPNDNLLTTSLISTLALVTVTHWALPILITMGVLIVGISIIKNGSIVKIMYRFITAIAVLVIGYSFIVFLSSLNGSGIKFTNQLIVTIVLMLIFAAIITPLRSLARSSNRRQDLVTFETNAKDKKIKNTLTFSIFITIGSLIAMFIFFQNTAELIQGYFIAINKTLWLGVLIYLLAILLPTIAILFIDKKYKYNSILSVIPYMTLILNPVTLPLICRLAQWEYGIYLIFVPEVLILTLWVVTESIKLIPDNIKI